MAEEGPVCSAAVEEQSQAAPTDAVLHPFTQVPTPHDPTSVPVVSSGAAPQGTSVDPAALPLPMPHISPQTVPDLSQSQQSPGAHNGSGPLQDRQPTRRPDVSPVQEWKRYQSMFVKVFKLPRDITTYDIWHALSKNVKVLYIEIWHTKDQNTGAKARIEPPANDPWRGGIVIRGRRGNTWHKLEIDPKGFSNDSKTILNPLNKPVPSRHVLVPRSIAFGTMASETLMFDAPYKVPLRDPADFRLTLELDKKSVMFNFAVALINPEADGEEMDSPHVGNYRITFKFSAIKKMLTCDSGEGRCSVVIHLGSPPRFFREVDDARTTHSDRLTWAEHDLWQRQTFIVEDVDLVKYQPASVKREFQQIIDLGRWTTYRLEFPADEWTFAEKLLHDFNVKTHAEPMFKSVPEPPVHMWHLLDAPAAADVEDYADLYGLECLNSIVDHGLGSLGPDGDHIELAWEVRYQLEACISHGALMDCTISQDFLQKLSEMRPRRAKIMLEYLVDRGVSFAEDPMKLFEDDTAVRYVPDVNPLDLPEYCTMLRKAVVTPSKVYLNSPTVETTNRVLRHYNGQHDRFLRVQFTDELTEGRINAATDLKTSDQLFIRIFRTLRNGVRIGGRHFEFLAFGSSQLRENSAYFFCPTANLSCDQIRSWMGKFSHIRVVGKYAARIGQCFSTTRNLDSKPQITTIPDIERNGYTFTDGVGKISPYWAALAVSQLDLKCANPPSAFQIRMGGCKGMLVVWKDLKGLEILIRPSQSKFETGHSRLEIIRCSQYAAATLNRQTITILHSLGVPDHVFLEMLSEQLEAYDKAMECPDRAMELLTLFVDENQMTQSIATWIDGGLMDSEEPFVLTLLQLWRAWSIKYLKERARIVVEKGAFVLGCVDETATLRGHFSELARANSYQHKRLNRSLQLPQIFLQVPIGKSHTYKVVTGRCIVGRNPSLHPGDIRVVEAVDRPELRHLRDVVVFPQTGDRDIPNMCSGGDLDGDDYFVIWDERLMPPPSGCNDAPMDYRGPKPVELDRDVTPDDLHQFFVRYMKHQSLGAIAHAHLAQADQSPYGARSEVCKQLASLHSQAVDYPKTGHKVEMRTSLNPKKFPHFMEKPKHKTYHSRGVLGQMYDRVRQVNFQPAYEMPFNRTILGTYELDRDMLRVARQLKTQYDEALRKIMGQREIATEFEVFSAFVLSRPRVGSDYKQQEDMGREAVMLKTLFRDKCVKAGCGGGGPGGPGSRHLRLQGPFVAAMYQVTAEEVQMALRECELRAVEPSNKNMPLISFPWIFDTVLVQLARGKGLSLPDPMAAVNSSSSDNDPTTSTEDGRLPPARSVRPVADLEQVQISARLAEVSDEEIATMDCVRTRDGHLIHRGVVLNLLLSDGDEDAVFGEDLDLEGRDAANPATPDGGDNATQEGVVAHSDSELDATAWDKQILVQDVGNEANGGCLVQENSRPPPLDLLTEEADRALADGKPALEASATYTTATTTLPIQQKQPTVPIGENEDLVDLSVDDEEQPATTTAEPALPAVTNEAPTLYVTLPPMLQRTMSSESVPSSMSSEYSYATAASFLSSEYVDAMAEVEAPAGDAIAAAFLKPTRAVSSVADTAPASAEVAAHRGPAAVSTYVSTCEEAASDVVVVEAPPTTNPARVIHKAKASPSKPPTAASAKASARDEVDNDAVVVKEEDDFYVVDKVDPEPETAMNRLARMFG